MTPAEGRGSPSPPQPPGAPQLDPPSVFKSRGRKSCTRWTAMDGNAKKKRKKEKKKLHKMNINARHGIHSQQSPCKCPEENHFFILVKKSRSGNQRAPSEDADPVGDTSPPRAHRREDGPRPPSGGSCRGRRALSDGRHSRGHGP